MSVEIPDRSEQEAIRSSAGGCSKDRQYLCPDGSRPRSAGSRPVSGGVGRPAMRTGRRRLSPKRRIRSEGRAIGDAGERWNRFHQGRVIQEIGKESARETTETRCTRDAYGPGSRRPSDSDGCRNRPHARAVSRRDPYSSKQVRTRRSRLGGQWTRVARVVARSQHRPFVSAAFARRPSCAFGREGTGVITFSTP